MTKLAELLKFLRDELDRLDIPNDWNIYQQRLEVAKEVPGRIRIPTYSVPDYHLLRFEECFGRPALLRALLFVHTQDEADELFEAFTR